MITGVFGLINFMFPALSININFILFLCVYIEDSSDHFKIDANSGEIRTTTILSYDYRPSYRMTVIASDQGVPPLQGQAVINIQVMFRHHHKMWKDILRFCLIFIQLYRVKTLDIYEHCV